MRLYGASATTLHELDHACIPTSARNLDPLQEVVEAHVQPSALHEVLLQHFLRGTAGKGLNNYMHKAYRLQQAGMNTYCMWPCLSEVSREIMLACSDVMSS